uniref:Carbamoyl phosphate synthase small chain n=1 Tax=Sebdenia flabellata TaxID=42024 RepID=A0A1C9CA05_9FLOR|nr:carbamoyl-phosphate synthase arginine-specific small subunit [Sebdenia flabellata]AOM65208.1 carbamoyl-phosphate synthase arginine-specific small subunit [Sebdenia flabellata]
MKKSYYPTILYLEDGTNFKGWSFTNSHISFGEVVFNTGMTGYQEIMTDPSYKGQIMTFTYPEIGNTGLNKGDNESNTIHVKGIVSKNICYYPSNWRSKISLKDYLLKNNIPHIFGIDTRRLTKHLRNHGAMNGCISSKILDINTLNTMIQKSPLMAGLDLVNQVTVNKAYKYIAQEYSNKVYSYINYKLTKQVSSPINIVLIDFGVKNNILLRLVHYGCKINILPAKSTLKNILSYKPDGIILSNGPGDPSAIDYGINTIKKVIYFTNIPIFGICMGHQIISLALGGSTFKLKFGHRGINHPSGINQNAEITSQNHGFAVNMKSIPNNAVIITHFNLNDTTIAGIRHSNKPIFSVQYHPEASPGPHDSDYLFKSFIHLVELINLPHIQNTKQIDSK